MAATMRLYLKFGIHSSRAIDAPTTWTADDLKAKIEEMTGVPQGLVRLIYRDASKLLGDRRLRFYGIGNGSQIHVIVGEQEMKEDPNPHPPGFEPSTRRREQALAYHRRLCQTRDEVKEEPSGFEPS